MVIVVRNKITTKDKKGSDKKVFNGFYSTVRGHKVVTLLTTDIVAFNTQERSVHRLCCACFHLFLREDFVSYQLPVLPDNHVRLIRHNTLQFISHQMVNGKIRESFNWSRKFGNAKFREMSGEFDT